jgi:hypothetical protein
MARFSEDVEKSMIFENYGVEHERFTLISILKNVILMKKGDYVKLKYRFQKL